VEYVVIAGKFLLSFVYFVIYGTLCVFGVHKYLLARTYGRCRGSVPVPASRFEVLPKVTVQLPIYNEMYVVERLIDAVCRIDYPRELLEIQVLDDSTDSTREIAKQKAEFYAEKGYRISYIHREGREGYKAGALENGLKLADGEFIAIFDADFIPSPDVLKKAIDFFTDPKVGIVQMRWGHVNRDYSMLTSAQALLLDGHFVIEQASRYHRGFFFNFNGTAGVLRRSCIETSGGWQHDTLTEDLDLSYRAQLAGWKLVYLKDIIVDAELPVDMNSFKSQQHRWTKGAIQTARKLLGRVLASPTLTPRVKLEAALHLLGSSSYLLLMLLIILMPPMASFWAEVGRDKVVLFSLISITSGLMSLVYFYWVTLKEMYPEGWLRRIHHIPLAIAIGSGLAVSNSGAVLEALLGKKSEFKRTPKFNVKTRTDTLGTSYRLSPKLTTIAVELAIGSMFFAQTLLAIKTQKLEWIPFLLILQTGFFYTGILSLIHSRSPRGYEHTRSS
jgi:cellulose synthase/poly-beta-1,6-N-acetylglucosamine synthase-like glycosyltransferase